jgi:hypothetical protein
LSKDHVLSDLHLFFRQILVGDIFHKEIRDKEYPQNNLLNSFFWECGHPARVLIGFILDTLANSMKTAYPVISTSGRNLKIPNYYQIPLCRSG